MKLNRQRFVTKGLTLLELLLVVLVIWILTMLFLPSLSNRNRKAKTPRCMMNEQQILAGEKMWQQDNGEHRWLAFSRKLQNVPAHSTNVAAEYFQTTLSNYLKNPQLFLCPFEKTRRPCTTGAKLMNSNLSYSVRLTASVTNPSQSVLIGDRHLQVDGKPLPPGLHEVSGAQQVVWSNELHPVSGKETSGVLGFVDGHVEVKRSSKLGPAFAHENNATNLLAIP